MARSLMSLLLPQHSMDANAGSHDHAAHGPSVAAHLNADADGQSNSMENLHPSDRELARRIDATLSSGFRWLRFPHELEARYITDTAKARLRTLQIAGTLVAFVLNLFLIADQAMIPDMFDTALLLRVWIYIPLCLAGMWVMSQLNLILLRELLSVLAIWIAGAMHLVLCVASESQHAHAYTTGLVMVILYSVAFIRARFWLAAPTAVGLLLMFGVAWGLLRNPSFALMGPICLVLVATVVFTLHYVYVLEHDERQNYLLALRQKLLQQELSNANRQLERVSRVDALTQVANRRHFDHYLGQVWERALKDDTEVSLIMLDVDCFKAYNDLHGHPAGDACLVKVAQALSQSLRRPGDLVARYGGEEFIAVLHKAGTAQTLAAAERVRQAVLGMAMPHGDSFVDKVVTVSLGVATIRPSERLASTHKLTANADEALYQAKNRGRNRVWVHAQSGASHANTSPANDRDPGAEAAC